METKTYLLKHEYDFKNKKMKNVKGSKITLQFKIMDSCTMLEIIGSKTSTGFEEFKHQILCHKEQDIVILPPVNDQIDQVKNLEPIYQTRIFIDRESDIISVEDLGSDHDADNKYMLGLHGQLDLFEEEVN